MRLEREETKMKMKKDNEHIDFEGHCDDWNSAIHDG